MTLRRAARCRVGKGAIGSYVHNTVSDGLGKIGVIVALESTGKADELAAHRPPGRHAHRLRQSAWRSIPAGLDPAVVKREKDVLADKFKAAGQTG